MTTEEIERLVKDEIAKAEKRGVQAGALDLVRAMIEDFTRWGSLCQTEPSMRKGDLLQQLRAWEDRVRRGWDLAK